MPWPMAFGFDFRGLAVLLVLTAQPVSALDRSITQLVVSISPGWNSPTGRLQLFEREGKGWRAVSPALRVL